jgi:hypothetical protein
LVPVLKLTKKKDFGPTSGASISAIPDSAETTMNHPIEVVTKPKATGRRRKRSGGEAAKRKVEQNRLAQKAFVCIISVCFLLFTSELNLSLVSFGLPKTIEGT